MGSANGIQRALISSHDKSGVVAFARALVEQFGTEILSTGGTARLLVENGVPVTTVETVTRSGEMLDGRVKTLHPAIHAGILADRGNAAHVRQLRDAGIAPIDMVVVSLYPFGRTVADPKCPLAEAVEMIDIGGPCLLRAAAKNHAHVWPVHSTDQFDAVLDVIRGGDAARGLALRRQLAAGVFGAISDYDRGIAEYLTGQADGIDSPLRFATRGRRVALRYGENPHQRAAWWIAAESMGGPALVQPIAGGETEISFNNVADADAASQLCAELSSAFGPGADARRCVSVIVKHLNACGVGVADDAKEAYRRAYHGDVNAAMGGILACNHAVDAAIAECVMSTHDRWGREAGAGGFFVEVWAAPSFERDAIEIIRARKPWGARVRLMAVGEMDGGVTGCSVDVRAMAGGALVQSCDGVGLNEPDWRVVTKRGPSTAEWNDLRLAWLVCKHTKSNAITIGRDGMLIGNGAGQMSRVMSCRIATWAAKENGHEGRLNGSVAASDAFFPFRDGPDVLLGAGVRAIIQPGGSKRDEETIAACDERDAAMVFTGTRHFRH
ncbi:MAG: bifunctional phosphoribosylaminoimidazolecarboxamide formyltransferase/IMP cyclohydrolase [Phycisphaerales bacterium]|nr:bifunctional phosphoribosylaminoimidazolecarboxamide formyltransferase/IMP cyclohydrolase [Phycisphaerales bacterium]